MIWHNNVVGRAFYSPCSCPFLKVSWDLGLAQIPRDFESWWQFSRHVRILDPIISLNHFNLILSLFFLGRIPVQSFAARITQLTCYSDTHQITYWLSLCSHNQHKVLVPIYKALHGLATFVSLFCNISLCSSPIHYPLLKVSAYPVPQGQVPSTLKTLVILRLWVGIKIQGSPRGHITRERGPRLSSQHWIAPSGADSWLWQ